MPKFLISLFTELASIIGGGVNGALGIMTSLIGKGFNMAVQFHKEGIAFAREVGLSAREAQAYTQVLTERTEKLALKYGVAADAIREVQRGIVDATGKQYMLNEAEAERQVQINKLVGAGTANQFTEQMMNHMGAQLSTVQGAVSKAYATAAKSGLNAAKFSKEVAKNLSLANKLSFRDGVNGIIRMTALSEKLGFNLQSVEAAANKFMDLDSAIESSAQLQMLGGAAGAYGSNPLTMAYEANYDPEAFTERMTKTLGGYASFDAKTGMSNVNGMNRDFVKGIAQAMGISMDEAMSIAKKQAEIKYKENAYAPELGKIKNQEQRDFILNKSYVDTKTGQLMINDIHGQAHNISENGIDGIIKELQEFDNMSEKDIMQKQAETLTNIQEQIDGIGASFAASIAKSLNQYIPGATTAIKNFAKEVQPSVVEIGRNVGEIVKTALDWLRENKETIKNVAKGVFSVTAWLTEHWPLLIALWAGKKVLGSAIGGKTIGARAASGGISILKSIATGIWNLHKGIYNIIRHPIRSVKSLIGGVRHIGSAAKGAWGSMSKVTKLGIGAGAVVGAVQGISAAYNYGKEKDQLKQQLDSGAISKQEYETKMQEAKTVRNEGIGQGVGTALGTAIGAFVGGPIGAAVGGWLGGEGGKMIGRHWDSISKAAKGVWDGIKSIAQGTWDAIKDIVMGYLNGAWEIIKGFGNALKDIFFTPFKDFWNTINFKDGFMNGILSIFKGVGVFIFDVIAGPFRAVGDIAKGVWNGIGEVAKGYWNGIKDFAKGAWDGIKQIGLSVWNSFKESLAEIPIIGKLFKSEEKAEPHANGGIVGGNSYSGDRVLTGLNSGEMVLNKNQQSALFNFINEMPSALSKIGTNGNVSYYNARNYSHSNISKSELNNTFNGIQTDLFRSIGSMFSSIVSPLSVLKNSNDVKAKPVGEKEYVYAPTNSNPISNGVTEVTVKDINVNVNGTLKLDAGNFTKNIDINQLLNDSSFVSQLKDLIKQSINNDINNGRFMNDIASMRGMPSQVGLWGRK